MFGRIKGTQDLLDLTLINFVLSTIKQHLITYHFTQIETPIIESTDLFTRSLGVQTDVVSKEMFLIKGKDQDSDGTICLRPEATASTVRAFVENAIAQTPWKAFSYGPMFRYERPQKGRFRQFHQINIETIGSSAVEQDVQFIKMLDRYFSEKLSLNNYALLINYLGCPEDRVRYRATLLAFLQTPQAQGICSLCQERKEKNLMRIFDCKVPNCQLIYQNAPRLIDSLCAPCSQEWQTLQNDLELLSVTFIVQPHLVRGLDYYQKTVFEFVSHNLGAQSAFCGGGRYDQLVSQIGGKQDQPSIGAAIGMERLVLLLEPYKDTLPLPQLPPLHAIVPMAPEQKALALLLADELQAHNLCTEIFLESDSMKSMMRKANKIGAKYVLILGENEQKTHSVTIKNMINGTEENMPQVNAVPYLLHQI
ncbi:histidine--tRNA ligase [Candidatus Dependentiae bacterium Noda2021]|nr:histidine--tRNA ligase [Candidatus Dependentiae bacterium Noda2021]